MDEKKAIQKMKKGKIEGLAFIWEQYSIKALRTAFLITQDHAAAEDVVQDTFLRVCQRIAQFDSRRPFEPWLMRCVVNAALQAAAKTRRTFSLEQPVSLEPALSLSEILPDPAPGPEKNAENSELKEQVQEALLKLSPQQRAAVVLRYYLELDENQTAETLQVAPATVRWRLFSARKKLRTWFSSPPFENRKGEK